MTPEVYVIDYGIGNLFSVLHALAKCGARPVLTDNPADIAGAERLVLPGVGAIADGMEGLRSRGFVEPIREHCRRNKPFLGICLGMQMMLDVSEEFGEHPCLGLIPGRVVPVPASKADGTPHRIPHIGWNGLQPSGGGSWAGTILDGTEVGTTVYFVHSYMAAPADESARLADCHYNGRVLSAAIRKGNCYGTQFHPERSGPAGLKMLENFVALPRDDS